jgi:hypothetical protein
MGAKEWNIKSPCGSTDFDFFCFRLQISTKTGSLRFGNK